MWMRQVNEHAKIFLFLKLAEQMLKILRDYFLCCILCFNNFVMSTIHGNE
jgi:hypothetical protein